jgi:hypothetical protein
MKRLVVLISIIAFIGGQSFGCTCAFTKSVEIEFNKSESVYNGKVISKKWIEDNGSGHFEIELELNKVFKGLENIESSRLILTTGPRLPACGFHFEIGKKYLVYSDSSELGQRTSQCTRTTSRWRKEEKMIKRLSNNRS